MYTEFFNYAFHLRATLNEKIIMDDNESERTRN
jgi:hypothetical protein